MWKILEQNKDCTYRQKDNTFEKSDKDGCIIRWIPSEDNGDINGKLVNYIPNEKTIGVTIFPGIEEIGYGAFTFYENDDGEWEAVSNNLQYVSIPSSVKHIENGAFAFCDLERVEISDSCPAAKIEEDAVLSKDGKRFIYKLVEKEFEDFDYRVPYGVEEIGAEAFNSCETNVILPNTVKKICSFAFGFFCNDVVVPESVVEIEKNAFTLDSKLIVVKNSYAHKWAKKNKINFEILKWFSKTYVKYQNCRSTIYIIKTVKK